MCLTPNAQCRSRHVKCDEIHPFCSNCRLAGLRCGGYEKNIFFDFRKAEEHGLSRFRRPLSSERERRRMSEFLTANVAPNSALRSILKVDEECERATMLHNFHTHVGPFGAFSASQALSNASINVLVDEAEDNSSPQVQATTDDGLLPSISFSWEIQNFAESMSPSFDEPSTSNTADFWNGTRLGSDYLEDNTLSGFLMPGAFDISIASLTPQVDPFLGAIPYSQIDHTLSSNTSVSLDETNSSVPEDAVLLLKHYNTAIIGLLTPFRHAKTPWHVLFVPHIKNCFAALTLGEHLDEASLTTFYGTLAMSAFSLGGIHQSSQWLEQGRKYKQQASEQAKLMLKAAYKIPKVAKYKSILMALLSMAHAARFSGSRDQTEYYFLEAEKFIRLRGLKRKKSRKVRLLHHCYAFERILYESIFVSSTSSSHRIDVRMAVESSGLVVYGQDSPSFGLTEWRDLDQQMSREKGQEEGENDLHLERPGIFQDTFYPEVFGIPEKWVQLLSQVIRLGNEKDAAERNKAANPPDLIEFLRRAKDLERCINHQQNPERVIGDFLDSANVLDNMLMALHHGLKIYFYRRIYDMDPSMLQQNVLSILDCLLKCKEGDPPTLFSSAGFVWPAFVAACEAEGQETQTMFSSWFRNSAERSGLQFLPFLLTRVEQLWRSRHQHGFRATWLELMSTNP